MNNINNLERYFKLLDQFSMLNDLTKWEILKIFKNKIAIKAKSFNHGKELNEYETLSLILDGLTHKYFDKLDLANVEDADITEFNKEDFESLKNKFNDKLIQKISHLAYSEKSRKLLQSKLPRNEDYEIYIDYLGFVYEDKNVKKLMIKELISLDQLIDIFNKYLIEPQYQTIQNYSNNLNQLKAIELVEEKKLLENYNLHLIEIIKLRTLLQTKYDDKYGEKVFYHEKHL